MSMEINYKTGIIPTAEQIIDLYDNTGLPRPTNALLDEGKSPGVLLQDGSCGGA